MKKRIVTITCMIHLLLSSHLYAFTIPVIDWSNLIEATASLKMLKEQYSKQKEIFDNANGSRNLAHMIDSTYDLVFEIVPEEILQKHNIDSASDHGLTGETARLYDLGNAHAAHNMGTSQASLNQSKDRFLELAKLIEKVNHSPDQKDILDLTARIESEVAMLNNELIKIQSLQYQYAAQERIRQQMMLNELLKKSGELPTF